MDTASSDLSHVIRRLALPALIFALIVTALLLLSWFLLLPRWSQVAVGGQLMDAGALREYGLQLQADIASARKQRDVSVLPEQDPTHAALLSDKRAGEQEMVRLMEDIRHLAETLSPVPDAIHIDRLHADPMRGSIELTGDVRGVELASMTVLARFTSALEEIAGIARVDLPAFERVEDAVSGPHSPFTFTVHLRES